MITKFLDFINKQPNQSKELRQCNTYKMHSNLCCKNSKPCVFDYDRIGTFLLGNRTPFFELIDNYLFLVHTISPDEFHGVKIKTIISERENLVGARRKIK